MGKTERLYNQAYENIKYAIQKRDYKTIILKAFWYSEQGRSKIVARIYGMIPEALMVFTFLKVYNINVSIPGIILYITIAYAISVGLGYWYTNKDMLKIETELNNKHNPMLQRIEEGLNGRRKKDNIHTKHSRKRTNSTNNQKHQN